MQFTSNSQSKRDQTEEKIMETIKNEMSTKDATPSASNKGPSCGRQSSVVSSAPTILRLQVRIQSTPPTLFSICIEIMTKKNENKKEAGIWPF